MEKCTYCVQRIERRAPRRGEGDRPLRDGDVDTACQNACPTQAITFGDLNDPTSRSPGCASEPRTYALLGELGTQPRTTYLAEMRNPHPELPRGPRG